LFADHSNWEEWAWIEEEEYPEGKDFRLEPPSAFKLLVAAHLASLPKDDDHRVEADDDSEKRVQ